MSPEVVWLQLGCIIILYTQSKVSEPKMNSFLRMLTVVPIGVFAGHGFWKTWMILQGHALLSSFGVGQLAVYALTLLSAACVVGSLVLLVRRLFAK